MDISLKDSKFAILLSQDQLTDFVNQIVSEKLGKQVPPPPEIQEDERITRHQISELYKISLPTVHACMKHGLPYEKCGRKTLFIRKDVDAFFKSKKA